MSKEIALLLALIHRFTSIKSICESLHFKASPDVSVAENFRFAFPLDFLSSGHRIRRYVRHNQDSVSNAWHPLILPWFPAIVWGPVTGL